MENSYSKKAIVTATTEQLQKLSIYGYKEGDLVYLIKCPELDNYYYISKTIELENIKGLFSIHRKYISIIEEPINQEPIKEEPIKEKPIALTKEQELDKIKSDVNRSLEDMIEPMIIIGGIVGTIQKLLQCPEVITIVATAIYDINKQVEELKVSNNAE